MLILLFERRKIIDVKIYNLSSINGILNNNIEIKLSN